MGFVTRADYLDVRKKTIEMLQATKNQSKTASVLRLSFDQVNRVMRRAVERGLSRRDLDEIYENLSFDEKSVGRGHDYITVLSDSKRAIVIEVEEGRTKESVSKLCIKSLSKTQRSKVKTVSTDMWDAYIYGAKSYFPNALHSYDNFHLVGYLNKAVDKVRRREVKTQSVLKQTKYIFLKDEKKLSEKQKLKFERIKELNLSVSKAWQIKENFRAIEFNQSREEAMLLYENWVRDALEENIKEITDVVQMFERHREGIINAIETGANNGKAERLNGSIQELKTVGRGYRKTENMRIVILFHYGNLDLFPHKTQ